MEIYKPFRLLADVAMSGKERMGFRVSGRRVFIRELGVVEVSGYSRYWGDRDIGVLEGSGY